MDLLISRSSALWAHAVSHIQTMPDFRVPASSVSGRFGFHSFFCQKPWCSGWESSAVTARGWAGGWALAPCGTLAETPQQDRVPLCTYLEACWDAASSVTMVIFHYRS